ncbi:DUF4190 domain-containing protein [Paenarthrobacter sp. NPDC089322]|uniref:DUF4190 domain-containing protein n=1 Tax=Paenarthrobacter sp. NPDC089322 TaxID=3155065 RepID=UPI003439F0E8
MSDQPSKGHDDKPAGYEPPQYVPPAEFSAPESRSSEQGASVAPPPFDAQTQPIPPYEQNAYTQNAQGQDDFYTRPQPTSSYSQPTQSQPTQSTSGSSPYTPGDYSQPSPSPYGQPPSPYQQQAFSQQPYGQPNPYGQPAYYAMPTQPKGLSIAAMCCGIAIYVGFGFFILPQIAAVILGHLALNREPAGKGMAIAGLVMGYLGVAITVVVFIVFVAAIGAAGSYNY